MVAETVGTSDSQWIVATGLGTDGQVPEIGVADLTVLIEASQDPILPLGQSIPVAIHAVVKSIRLGIVPSNRDMARFQSRPLGETAAPGCHAPGTRPPNGVAEGPTFVLSGWCIGLSPGGTSESRLLHWNKWIRRYFGIP